MTIAFGQFGEQQALGYITNKVTAPENLVYNFFTSNITPTNSDTYATYSPYLASGGGYAPKTMTGSSWSISGSNPAVATVGSAQVWTFTGPLTGSATIYGYFVTGATNTTSEYFAEKFTASFTPANNGDTLTMTPTIAAQ